MEALLTPEIAARLLAVTEKRLHSLCRAGKLAYVRIDERGTRRFRESDIEAYVEAQTVQARPPVDFSRSHRLPYPRKGGDSRKSTGESVKAKLREELRQWR